MIASLMQVVADRCILIIFMEDFAHRTGDLDRNVFLVMNTQMASAVKGISAFFNTFRMKVSKSLKDAVHHNKKNLNLRKSQGHQCSEKKSRASNILEELESEKKVKGSGARFNTF